MTKVAVNLQERLLKRSLYVALSRCKTLAGLYLYGSNNILPPNILCLTAEEKKEKVEFERARDEQSQVIEYMMRKKPMVNAWPFLLLSPEQLVNERAFSLMFLNCASFSKRHQAIAADCGFMKADLIFLCETRGSPNNTRSVFATSPLAKDYTLEYVSGSTAQGSANGQIVLKKINANGLLSLICCNAIHGLGGDFLYETSNCCEISLFKYETAKEKFIICTIYKHPNFNDRDFYKEIKIFLTHFIGATRAQGEPVNLGQYKFILIGDFNIDYSDPKSKTFVQKLHAKVPGLVMAHNEFTTDSYTMIDWCMITNLTLPLNRVDCKVYENYYGTHKPIWFSVFA